MTNVSLRAVHDALRGPEGPAARWIMLIGRLDDHSNHGVLDETNLLRVLRSTGVGGSANEWCVNLRTLAVIDREGRLDAKSVSKVRTALELIGDSFDVVGSPQSWAPVATLPADVRLLLQPPPLRQTAGVMLELIDRAASVIRLAAPFVDPQAVTFLSGSLIAARRRGVDISVVTSVGRGMEFAKLNDGSHDDPPGGLRVTEVRTELSSLGSHAKVLLVDDQWAYVGSANLTMAGLGRHVEIGVEVAGPQVEDLARLLVALERLGSHPLSTADT